LPGAAATKLPESTTNIGAGDVKVLEFFKWEPVTSKASSLTSSSFLLSPVLDSTVALVISSFLITPTAGAEFFSAVTD
jgi:hypothetical protein